MTITYRPVIADEFEAFRATNAFGFGHNVDDTPFDEITLYGELERTTAAFEDGEIVGTTGIYSFDLTVPGGTVPTAGVTWVAVRPTHRRKGILRGLMRTQLDNVRERGEALAALWASEAPIYGQFGYGQAAEGVEMRIERPFTALRHIVPFSGRTRLVEREEALMTWPAVYEMVRPHQPGMISRSQKWWELRQLWARSHPPSGYSKSYLIQYEEAGQALGYVRYQIKEVWDEGAPAGKMRVLELIAATPAAYSGLWSYLFGVDLIGTITQEWGHVDEPLTHMLADPRRLVRRTQDTLFVRLVDVPKALAGRKYSADGQLVFEVNDAFCPWNSGRYVLEGGREGATCSKTDVSADIVLDAEALGAVYLGGNRFQTLARAGRVHGSIGALRRADAMFAWDPLPWIPEIF
jgi:predicted acetyltransferase